MMYFLQILETEEERQLFTELYERHKKQMWYVANSILHNQHDAEDMVQEAFARAAKAMPGVQYRIRGKRGWRNYLLKIAYNRSIIYLMREKRRRKIGELLEEELVTEDVLTTLCENEAFETLVQTIMSLREPYKTVLSMHYDEHLSQAELAATLGVKPATIRKQLSRGRDLLWKALTEKEEANAHV